MVSVIVLRRRSYELDLISLTSAITLHIFTFILAPVGYMGEWKNAQLYIDQATPENAWGFGQVIPVFMLLVPIFTFVGALTGMLVTARFISLSLLHSAPWLLLLRMLLHMLLYPFVHG